jgi:hypothetical protein
MKPASYERGSVTFQNGKTVTVATLTRQWRGQCCGSRLTERYDEDHPEQPWRVHCNCREDDFVTERQLAQSRADAMDVMDGLPAEFLATLKGE